MSSCCPSQLHSRYSWVLGGTDGGARTRGAVKGPEPWRGTDEGADPGGACRLGARSSDAQAPAASLLRASVPVQSGRAQALLYVVTGQQQDGA